MSARWFKWGASGLIAIAFVFCVTVSLQWHHMLTRPMPIQADQPIIIQLDKNESAIAFIRALAHRKWVSSPRLLRIFLWQRGWSNQLKAGIYAVKPGETVAQLLQRVVRGEVMTLPLRIIEGVTQASLSKDLTQSPYLTYQSSDWNKILDGHPSAEGLLLADTYYYDAGSTSLGLLKRANQQLWQYLNESWNNRSMTVPYKSPYEMLIAASIIEKETANSDERRLISGVIVNRLRKGMPLQMDPTVIYALGPQASRKLSHQDLAVDSPFNTYKHYGLPPTPISMVGKESIDAAAHPADTPFLYYVSRGDGHHNFSQTYQQQRKAVTEYLKR